MNRKTHNVFCIVAAAMSLTACDRTHFADDYWNGLRRLSDLPSRMRFADRVIGKSGSQQIRERDFAYDTADGGTIQPSDLRNMDAGLRGLTIRKALLRRLVVEQGIREGIFTSADAAAFLQPKLEKILEEYYYYKKGNGETLTAGAEETAPDDEALAALLKTDPQLTKHGAGMADLKRERARVVRRMVERRAEGERQKLIQDILKNNPPIEVFP